MKDMTGAAAGRVPRWVAKAIEGARRQAAPERSPKQAAVWTTAYINDLPDSAFLYIEPGGKKDSEGKTVPRRLRHFPYQDKNGKVDLPHLRNALARIPQSNLPAGVKARVAARARRILERTKKKASDAPTDAPTDAPMVALKARVLKAGEGSPSPKRIVYGVVSSPYEVDAQGDWIPPATIEEMAHGYLERSRKTDYMHERPSEAVVVESFVEPYPSREDYEKAMKGQPHRATERPFGGDVVRSGEWVAGVRVTPDEWEQYLKGELAAFSIVGSALTEPLKEAEMPEVEVVRLGAS